MSREDEKDHNPEEPPSTPVGEKPKFELSPPPLRHQVYQVPSSCEHVVEGYKELLKTLLLSTPIHLEPERPNIPCLCEELLLACKDLKGRQLRDTAAFGMASHELRTPLSVMIGYADLLLSGKLGPLRPKQWNVLNEMSGQCRRLKKVVDGFLELTSLEAGKLKMNFISADMDACLAELYESWQPVFAQKGVTLFFTRVGQLIAARFDIEKTNRIVSNLLENALKATPPGGTVSLTSELRHRERRLQAVNFLSERRLQAQESPNFVQVSVSDTGPGIPFEHQRDIFNPFVQLSEGGTEIHLGLGLYFAQRVAEAHGGKIWVESQPGTGSKFCFMYPLRPPADTDAK